jgi:hypothetical protein
MESTLPLKPVKANIQASKYYSSGKDSKKKMNGRTTAEKVAIYRKLFTGLLHVYGTYDPKTGHTWQVKAPVTDRVIRDHFMGRQPYGVYLLVEERTRAIAVDFDSENRQTVAAFVDRAKHYSISAYVERSKSKGYHAWIFCEEQGVPAAKARLVVHHLLNEIEAPHTEVFPKHNAIDKNNPYSSFINAPLFGPLVPQGKSVFLDLQSFIPHPDQWTLLESVHRLSEKDLDEIIALNGLPPALPNGDLTLKSKNDNPGYVLPVCARKMLKDGVSQMQRVSCFRLAVHLKRLGLPYDVAVAALKTWALKNKPTDSKRIIQDLEIISKTQDAYKGSYTGYGCGTEAVGPFCEPSCPVMQWREKNTVPFGEENHQRARE